MSDNYIMVSLAMLVIAAGALIWVVFRRKSTATSRAISPLAGIGKNHGEVASSIVIGMSPDHPAFEISTMVNEAEFDQSEDVPSRGGSGLLSNLSACLQAVPSVLVQKSHQGRQLMEVVINNPLVQSADGSHFLPFAKGANGKIIEQAKLFDTQRLNQLVNASAIWQIASVAVAQKHLADISAKLDDIKDGLDDIKGMLQDKSNGDIKGVYRYLVEVVEVFEMGGLPTNSQRTQVENSYGELLKAEEMLFDTFERAARKNIEHKETFGTGDLLSDTIRRYDELDKTTDGLMTCLKAKILAWYVLSLFPDEEESKLVRKKSILKSIGRIGSLSNVVNEISLIDTKNLDALFNFDATLKRRRDRVEIRTKKSVEAIDGVAARCYKSVESVTLMLERDNDPVRLGMEFVHGVVQNIRVLAKPT